MTIIDQCRTCSIEFHRLILVSLTCPDSALKDSQLTYNEFTIQYIYCADKSMLGCVLTFPQDFQAHRFLFVRMSPLWAIVHLNFVNGQGTKSLDRSHHEARSHYLCDTTDWLVRSLQFAAKAIKFNSKNKLHLSQDHEVHGEWRYWEDFMKDFTIQASQKASRKILAKSLYWLSKW